MTRYISSVITYARVPLVDNKRFPANNSIMANIANNIPINTIPVPPF